MPETIPSTSCQGRVPAGAERVPSSAELALGVALRISMNRHWLARLVIGCWALQIPLVAVFAPRSMTGQALAQASGWGHVVMAVIVVMAGAAVLDSAVNDMHLLPSRLTQFLMEQRHLGFMLLAIALVIAGGGIAVLASAPIVFVSFCTPAAFCVVLTFVDLRTKHNDRRTK